MRGGAVQPALPSVSLQAGVEGCSVSAYQFARDRQEWVARKLSCKQFHLVCLLDDAMMATPTEAEVTLFPGLATNTKLDLHVPHIVQPSPAQDAPLDY